MATKREFEEWLYEEARVAANITTATMASSMQKYSLSLMKRMDRPRVFVEAQHQNGEAERAIMTVVSVAREFMTHAAMSWGEDGSDDLSLRPCALDHAAWLCNRVPQ